MYSFWYEKTHLGKQNHTKNYWNIKCAWQSVLWPNHTLARCVFFYQHCFTKITETYCCAHVVISGSKTNSNFRRKTNLAGTSTVRVCNSASPRRAGWQIHNLQSRTAWKKKVAKASRVLAFEGMFIQQHTFLVIKSEIKQLFIFLCISYITLKLLLAEGLLIWTQRLFVLWNGLMNGLIRESKITTKRYQICKQASLLCRYEGAIERCPSSYSPCWQEGQRSFVFVQGSLITGLIGGN